jgi:hypothetical protein
MHRVAPSHKDTASATLERHLWDAADPFRANSGLKAQEYSAGSPPGPVLGLIFLSFLEALARALHREWFVHFHFPGSRAVAGAKADGHEIHPRVASPFGDIPQGWEVELVRDILTRRAAGSVYREADVKQEGAIPVLDQSTNELLGFPRPGEPPCDYTSATKLAELEIAVRYIDRPFLCSKNDFKPFHRTGIGTSISIKEDDNFGRHETKESTKHYDISTEFVSNCDAGNMELSGPEWLTLASGFLVGRPPRGGGPVDYTFQIELTRDRLAMSRSPEQVEPASAEQIAQNVESNR